MKRDPVLPGQESVRDYPRPAIAQATDARLRIVFAGRTLAERRNAVRTRETSHPPTYYPTPAFAAIRNHVAVYPGPMHACFVDGKRVTPREGAFYGGWITSTLAGPFKGPPGTQFR